MAENTKENPKTKFSIEKTKLSPLDEVESAKILFQEGLIEEAKKVIYRIQMIQPNFTPAIQLLAKINKEEEKKLFQSSQRAPRVANTLSEDSDFILKSLDRDLGLELHAGEVSQEQENFITNESLSAREHYDLGVAFFQIDCFLDSIRELKKAERKIRLEESFLGELGVSVVSLHAECLFKLGRSYEAKSFLEPILTEPEINLEEKISFFYLLGLVELDLGNIPEGKAWFQKVIDLDPQFRDTAFRLKTIK